MKGLYIDVENVIALNLVSVTVLRMRPLPLQVSLGARGFHLPKRHPIQLFDDTPPDIEMTSP